MNNRFANNKRLVVSYLMLRKAIGCLGMALPFVLALGGLLIFKTGIQPSVSDYYYTGMGDVFVGTLFAMGVFLFSYKGYGQRDNLAGNVAAVCVIGTALFPTTPENASALAMTIGKVHLTFATLYFATLAYFSLALFTKSDPTRPPTPQKLQRNRVYRICGYTIVAALVAIALLSFLPDSLRDPLRGLDPVFWLESVAIIAFGVSWFVKGEGILEDEK
ncbi:MAG: hypothetical protein WA885_21985 [Phormidesmis sp.]